jgi:8-oxo-dGTP pyrophosphatase MutT (NUDIX family)
VNGPHGPVVQECVEGYLYARPPLEILVFRRPPSRGRIWVPVSGKVDPDDVSFEAALARELREETGRRPIDPPEPLDWHVPFRAENGDTWRLHAYAVRVERSFVPELSPEHEAFEWVSPDEAIHRLRYPDNQEAVRRLVARVARREDRPPGRGPP